MISLETIGYYSNENGLAELSRARTRFPVSAHRQLHRFVGNVASRSLLRDSIGEFRRGAQIPSEAALLPASPCLALAGPINGRFGSMVTPASW